MVDAALEFPKPRGARVGGVKRRCGQCRGAMRGPARSMGVQKAAPIAPASSRWGPLASGDASVPTAASDGSEPPRRSCELAYTDTSSIPSLASSLSAGAAQGREVHRCHATEAQRLVALTTCVSTLQRSLLK